MRNTVRTKAESTIKVESASKGRTKVFRKGDNRLLGVILGEQFKIDIKNRRLYKSDMSSIISAMI